MGRLLILLVIIIVTVVLLGLWGLFLDRQKTRSTLGLQHTKKQYDALQAREAQHASVLQEIHDLAQTEITLAENGDGASMWQVVQGLAAEALTEKKDKP